MTSRVFWIDEIPGGTIYKKDQLKLKHFEKIVSLNKFYIIFHFLSLRVFISIQNIGRSIPFKFVSITDNKPHIFEWLKQKLNVKINVIG